jgi:hypothetical protein
MSAFLRPPSLQLEIIAIRFAVYPDEFSHSFRRLDKDVVTLAALHSVQRVDFHYDRVGDKPASMRSFFAQDLL